MAYSDFTLAQINTTFGITIEDSLDLFSHLAPACVDTFFVTYMNNTIPLALAIGTEKAKSELIIAPILVEVRRIVDNHMSLFSGIRFTVDTTQGLDGTCDFLISRARQQTYLKCPVIAIVEAKNDNINSGLAQCIAEMIAANIFNQQQEHGIEPLYGAVTTGSQWKFLTLKDNTAYIDLQDYYINTLETILGILIHMVEPELSTEQYEDRNNNA